MDPSNLTSVVSHLISADSCSLIGCSLLIGKVGLRVCGCSLLIGKVGLRVCQ